MSDEQTAQGQAAAPETNEKPAARTWTDAPASANVHVYISGRDWQITIRADTFAQMAERIPQVNKWLDEHGGKANGQAKTQATSQPSTVPIAPPPPPVPAAVPQAQSGGQDTFLATKLVGNVNEGKAYWHVKGGRFEKFGVTVWPEVLKTIGLDAAALNPMTQYDLTGYIATYSINDKGKPEKVVSLIKAA